MSDAKTAKTLARPARTYPLLSVWAAYATSLVAFMVAGQTLTSRAREMFDALNVELPWIADIQSSQPRLVAGVFVLVGLLLLLATRIRTRRLLASVLSHGLAVFCALVGTLLLYSTELVFTHLQQALYQ